MLILRLSSNFFISPNTGSPEFVVPLSMGLQFVVWSHKVTNLLGKGKCSFPFFSYVYARGVKFYRTAIDKNGTHRRTEEIGLATSLVGQSGRMQKGYRVLQRASSIARRTSGTNKQQQGSFTKSSFLEEVEKAAREKNFWIRCDFRGTVLLSASCYRVVCQCAWWAESDGSYPSWSMWNQSMSM